MLVASNLCSSLVKDCARRTTCDSPSRRFCSQIVRVTRLYYLNYCTLSRKKSSQYKYNNRLPICQGKRLTHTVFRPWNPFRECSRRLTLQTPSQILQNIIHTIANISYQFLNRRSLVVCLSVLTLTAATKQHEYLSG